MATPQRLGKYEITEVLGQGAMGVVYKGFDPGIRRIVAIKTIRRELVEGERHAAAMLARFRNEAQAAGKLSHPGLVAVYDYGEDAEVAYIAMEFVEGNSLREYIGRGTRFAERDAVSIMSQLLEGLAHAHERRVWHRDIKPGNVIVMRNGKVKIADFGIARIEASELTQTGVMMGSPGYMAPEQYAAAQIDHRADLFAAGVVFYQLLTGAKPFVGTAEQVSYATCHTDPMRPSLAEPGKGWERYDPVLARALAKKPEDRYQSAEAFRAAVLAAHDAPAAAAVSEETIIVEVLRPAAAVELSGSPKPPPARAGGARAPAAPAASARWPWIAAAAVAAIAIAGAAAWRFLPVAPQKPDVEAELAKARADAEEAERRAKAAAADAEKAKRQLETQRAADAEKAKQQLEAQRAAEAKAKAEPKPKPRPVAAAPRPAPETQVAVAPQEPAPQPQPAPPVQEAPRSNTFLPSVLWGPANKAPSAQPATGSRYDGFWNVTRSCDAYLELPVQLTNWRMNVQGGEFVVGNGIPGQPGYNEARGKPSADGSLVLTGSGIAVSKRNSGKPIPVLFEGRLDGERFVLRGSIGDRPCTLVFARR